MKISHKLLLLLIITLACMSVEPTLAVSACSGTCNCYDQYYPSWSDAEHLWYADAYYFLNYCGEGPYGYGMPASNRAAAGGTADYWLNDGNRFYQSGSYEQAITSYAKAVKLNPAISAGWLNMANAFYHLGRYQESLDNYNAALNLEPQNRSAMEGKVKALTALNRTAEANAIKESP